MTLNMIMVNALPLQGKVEVYAPKTGYKILLDFTFFPEKRYAVRRGIVAFSDGKKMYVTQMNSDVKKTLEKEGYLKGSFWVPFSDWEYPTDPVLKKKWNKAICLG